MTNEQRQTIGKLWIAIAEMNGKEISSTALSLMLSAIQDLDAERVILALNDWARTSKQARHPLPAEIRALAAPATDPDAEAREAISRVVAAVSKFGWSNADNARAFTGELGWHIVERFGGWSYLCQNLGVSIDLTTFQAQGRDLAKATISRGPQGLENAPSLPASDKFNDVVKLALKNKQITGGTNGNE